MKLKIKDEKEDEEICEFWLKLSEDCKFIISINNIETIEEEIENQLNKTGGKRI